ncbi:MAG: hypothetical protein J6D36_01885 [Erysipelotrichaceae bacterium]|nr:hypothetical protein [Erysipelotrichaceae bacterium]
MEQTMQRNYELLTQAYIKPKEIIEITGTSKSTVSRYVAKHKLKRYPWGYETRKVIKAFGLTDYFDWLTAQKKN